MGNQSTSVLKSTIVRNDILTLSKILKDSTIREHINDPLNRKDDTPLALAVRLGHYDLIPMMLEAGAQVNTSNKDNETPIDILLSCMLPEDEDILRHHCCLYTCGGAEKHMFEIPEVLKLLLKSGAKGQGIQRLILHTMKDSDVIYELCQLIVDINSPQLFQLSGLLLQVAVWFDLLQCLQRLLIRGVDSLNFWKSTFVPTLVPNRTYRPPPPWPKRKTREYDLPLPPDSYAIQTLKLSFVQDWRAEWDDGSNPSAQYRAGLHLTPESAVIFSRSANRYKTLVQIMSDVLHFLPCSCSGPKLKDADLIHTLVLAGYRFNPEEIVHLQLKFNVDFKRYVGYQSQPKPLRHLCRYAVRFAMTVNVYCGVDRLSYLPNSLKNYILLQDGDLCL